MLTAKRSSLTTVPGRSGTVDLTVLPARDALEITVECGYAADTVQQMRRDAREIASLFSEPGELIFSDEPELRYQAELYNEIPLEPELSIGFFTLKFSCFPFALGRLRTVPIESGSNKIDYQGSAESPCLIVLQNPNKFGISNIQVTVIKRRR